MNQFNQFIEETEGNSRKVFESKFPSIESLIRKKQKEMSIDFLKGKKNLSGDLLIDSITYLKEMPKEYVEWLKKEVIKNYHNRELLKIALSNLTYKVYSKKDRKQLYQELKSLKLLKLMDDIFYIDEKEMFIIKKRNKVYYMQACATNLAAAKDAEGNCHEYTERLLKEASVKYKLDGCCVVFKDIFNNPYFHSFCINQNNIVIDPAYNIMAHLDLYLNVLDHKILFREKGTRVIRNIEKLNKTNKEFQESDKIDFLKYALLKGEENHNNEKILGKSLLKK